MLNEEEIEDYDFNEEIANFEVKKKLKFANLLKESNFKQSNFTNKQFWIKFMQRFPHLTQLAIVLTNIPCSSALVERFFSIYGIVCKKQSLAMNDDLIITRCLLKPNIQLLNELNDLSDDFE